jgi:methyltransferase
VIAPLYWILGIVAAQRLCELVYAERNTRALRERGAVEVAPVQHAFFVAVHLSWLLSMLLFIPAAIQPNWYLIGFYALLQGGRLWVLYSLRKRWTTRIIVLPGAPLVRGGPYRFLRHPNYTIVVLEIAVLPLAFGAYWIAAFFSVLNAIVLAWRIRAEDAALAASRRVTR